MRRQRANFRVAPGLCHSVAPGSLQASVDERLEPAHHSKVLTSARQWEAQQIDIVCVRGGEMAKDEKHSCSRSLEE